MSKQEKLRKALAEIKNLPDAYFDALMQEMGLSTSRRFPNQTDTPIVYTAAKNSQNVSSEKDAKIITRKSTTVHVKSESSTFRYLITSFRQNSPHSRTRHIPIINPEKRSYRFAWSHYQSASSTPSAYALHMQTQKHRTVSADLKHSSPVLLTPHRMPTV